MTTAPAAIRACSPITQRLRTVAPIAIIVSSPTTDAWTSAMTERDSVAQDAGKAVIDVQN